MSTFTVARYKDGSYEAFSFTEANFRGFYTWIHLMANRELLCFQGVFDPEVNARLAPHWINKDFDHLYKNDKWFDVKQVIIPNKGKYDVYTGKKGFPKTYSKVGNGWCCAGNLLELEDYNEYFDDSVMDLSYEQLLTKIKQLPVKLDKRTKGPESKGNYFEYTKYHVETDSVLIRRVNYEKTVESLQ
jgi:mRNA-degrading endonuclease YafQ of YafQ-DinJ toxin-antitoxin module